MKRLCIILTTALLALSSVARADEGMWIPMLLQRNEAAMQRAGMHITAQDIYDINNASLKDAVLLFGSGCTGEFVSNEGLLLTNHHCGYSQIVRHSTVEHDYLTNGFWAMSRDEEIPCPGLTVTRLVRMEDVTKQVLEGVKEGMSEAERDSIIKLNIFVVSNEATEGTHYKAVIKPFYYGNQYFMYINEVFTDVRMVGAPPSNIGKFGGDTDNWMWPRHTGDFSMFRVYVDKDNKPAPYSKDNVPYSPLKHLEISLKGVDEGDFTFVFGYPGTTRRYVTHDYVDLAANQENPVRIALRTIRLDHYNAAMRQSAAQRLKYASRVANIANGWKKWQGESLGIAEVCPGGRVPHLGQRQAAVSRRAGRDGGELQPAARGGAGVDLLQRGRAGQRLHAACQTAVGHRQQQRREAGGEDAGRQPQVLRGLRPTFACRRGHLHRVPHLHVEPRIRPLPGQKIQHHGRGGGHAAEDLCQVGAQRLQEAGEVAHDEAREDGAGHQHSKDPAVNLYVQAYNYCYSDAKQKRRDEANANIQRLMRTYVRGMMEQYPDSNFFPDANLTLRVAYGHVEGFKPKDATYYTAYSTIEGIMEKENPDIYDYRVEPRLKELWQKKDYGMYANAKGELPVAFIATNHTTGGNSGSPVLNADGQLVGINFDRCWEGTMSDLLFDPAYCRNISLDIRYCLFIIDKFAGARHLVDEMTLVEK